MHTMPSELIGDAGYPMEYEADDVPELEDGADDVPELVNVRLWQSLREDAERIFAGAHFRIIRMERAPCKSPREFYSGKRRSFRVRVQAAIGNDGKIRFGSALLSYQAME